MSKTASKYLAVLESWVGSKESDGSHKKIVDIYNSHKPLARGYKLPYDKPWCAATVSAAAIYCGYTDIIPLEVSCDKMITLAKSMGIWIENENVTPKPGWLVLYDWDDNGKGDNLGYPDHIGAVKDVSGGKFRVYEGNYNNAVGVRTLEVNGEYIRGYIAPKYDEEDEKNTGSDEPLPDASGVAAAPLTQTCSVALPVLRRGSSGGYVKTLQHLLNAYIGANLACDGVFGALTEGAVWAYQKARGLTVDGIVGKITWGKLLM